MSIPINPAISGFENVLALITAEQVEALPHALSASNVTLSAPAFYDDAANPNANTEVTLTAVLDAGYSGEVLGISYERPSILDIAGDPLQLGDLELDTTLYNEVDPSAYEADSLTRIATFLNLREEDIELVGAVPVPTSENNPLPVTIRPVTDSWIYSGANYTFDVVAADTDIPLGTVITVTELGGFTY